MGKTEEAPKRGDGWGWWWPSGFRLLVKMGWDTRLGENAPALRCCVLRGARVGVSTADLALMEALGEEGTEPLDAPTGTFLMRLPGSFRVPAAREWWKRMGGSWDWWARAKASGVVAAAAWSGAWTSGVQMTGVGEGGAEGGRVRLVWIS